MEDSQIINLFFTRSEQAISETDKKYGRFCYKIANNILESHEDSQECVNDTYFRAWNTIPPTRPTNFSAYLAKLTRHIGLDRWRRRNAEKRGGGEVAVSLEELEECIAGSQSVDAPFRKKELEAALGRFLEQLPKADRVLFVSRYWYLRPVKEIADKTGLSEGNVKTRLFRTRNKLRFFLEQEDFL